MRQFWRRRLSSMAFSRKISRTVPSPLMWYSEFSPLEGGDGADDLLLLLLLLEESRESGRSEAGLALAGLAVFLAEREVVVMRGNVPREPPPTRVPVLPPEWRFVGVLVPA